MLQTALKVLTGSAWADERRKREIIRCLKRYVIREVYHLVKVDPRTNEIAS